MVAFVGCIIAQYRALGRGADEVSVEEGAAGCGDSVPLGSVGQPAGLSTTWQIQVGAPLGSLAGRTQSGYVIGWYLCLLRQRITCRRLLTYWFSGTGHQLLVNIDWVQQYISLHKHTFVAIMVCAGANTHPFPFSPSQELQKAAGVFGAHLVYPNNCWYCGTR